MKQNAAEKEAEQATWVSPWGGAAFVVAALALLQASVPAVWWLTVALSALGVLLAGVGLWATREHPRPRDRMWLALGGGLSGVVLIVALAVPSLLNYRWAIDTAVDLGDPNHQVVVPRDIPREQGRPAAAADDWADASTEAIRQDDLFVRIESVTSTPPGKGDGPSLVVYLKLVNCKHERTIAVEGFDRDTHTPVLTDDAGRSYPFLEQRRRKPARGRPVFETSGPRGATLGPNDSQDYLLVFAAPGGFEPLKLEVPASAWGRRGMCKFRIARLFTAPIRPLQ